MFGEAESDQLPPHRKSDCAVELIPGAELPKTKLYPMTPKECEVLCEFFDKNLVQGFISPVSSSMATPILFRTKKDG